jgi:hypothetical protein
LDGQDTDDLIDADHLRLDGSEQTWDTAEVTVSVSTDEAQPHGMTDRSAYVLLACPATQLRRAYSMTPTANGGGFEARVSISRSLLA